MKVTDYLKKKLMKLEDEFTYKGEKFVMDSYGGRGENSYVYWRGDKDTIIHMEYSLKKLGHDKYQGINKVKDISMYK